MFYQIIHMLHVYICGYTLHDCCVKQNSNAVHIKYRFYIAEQIILHDPYMHVHVVLYVIAQGNMRIF